jgi:hypothetical protein
VKDFGVFSLKFESKTFDCKKLHYPYSTRKTSLQAVSLPANTHQSEENRQVQSVLQSIYSLPQSHN